MNDEELEQQAQKILEIAKTYGVESNYLFSTTFDRYQTQLRILSSLKEQIETGGTECKKEYVKGRVNVYAAPAVKEYNAMCSAADRTVKTLMAIIKAFKKSDKDAEDPLLSALKGNRDNDG